MKVLKVEYLEESSKAIFFNVTVEVKRLFKKPTIEVKRAVLEKWFIPNFQYANNFQWTDNTGKANFDDPVISEMILQYEKK